MNEGLTNDLGSGGASPLSRRFYAVSLTIAIAACLNVTDYFNELFGFPLPQTGYLLPYLAPFSLVFTLAVLWLRHPQTPIQIPFGWIDFCFMATLALWMAQELFYSIAEGMPFNPNHILSMSWLYFFFLTLRIHYQEALFRSYATIALIIITGVLSSVHLALHAAVLSQQVTDLRLFNFIKGNNGLSYLALLAVTTRMFLFLPVESRRMNWACNLFTATNIAVIVMNSTRGALLILILLSMLRMAFIESVRIRTAIFSALVFATLAIVLLHHESAAHFIHDNFLFGLSNGRDLSDAEVASIPGELNVGSTYVRNRVNLLLIEHFLGNPFLGMGLTSVENVTVLNTASHTGLLTILAAYGLVGSAPFFVALGYAFFIGLKRFWRVALPSGILLAATMVFDPSIRAWYAFAIIAMLLWPPPEVASVTCEADGG